MKEYFIYMMSSDSKTIYTGITSNLEKRIYEHKNGTSDGFTKKYSCHNLVYFEKFNNMTEAIEAEKKLKNWKRKWKENLIEKANPYWEDLSEKWN